MRRTKESTGKWVEYWELAESTGLDCGQGNPKVELELSSGAEESVRTELSKALSLSVPVHGLAIGFDQRTTMERTFRGFTSEKRKIKHAFKTEPCKRLSIAVWQVIELFEVAGTRAIWSAEA